MHSKSKKLVPIPEDTLKKMASLASKYGEGTFSFIARTLEEAIPLLDRGVTVKDAKNLYILVETLKKTGVMIIPGELLQFLLSSLPSEVRDQAFRVAYEVGEWFGKYILAKSGSSSDSLETFKELTPLYLWDASEFLVNNEEGKLKVRYISPGQTYERTMLLASFLEGVVNAMGYKTVSKEVHRGIIVLDFSQKECD